MRHILVFMKRMPIDVVARQNKKSARPPPLACRLRGEDEHHDKEILPFPELMRRCLMDGGLWSVEPGALIHH